MAKTKKRKPQDATLRNVRAANKRLDYIGENQMLFASGLNELRDRVTSLEKQVTRLLVGLTKRRK